MLDSCADNFFYVLHTARLHNHRGAAVSHGVPNAARTIEFTVSGIDDVSINPTIAKIVQEFVGSHDCPR